MAGYRDVKKAAEDEYKAIWGAWLIGGALWFGLTVWTDHVPVLGAVTYALLWVGGVLATAAAVYASWKVARKEHASREETLAG